LIRPELINIQKKSNWPAIGYFCRINSQNGFDKLVDAFIQLSLRNELPGLTLHVSGGFTSDDKPFIAEQIRKIKSNGLKKLSHNLSGISGQQQTGIFQ